MPSIIMMIVTSIYGVVDGLFVLHFVGQTAFAAVNFVMPYTMLFGGFGMMLGSGGSALVSKTMGEGDGDRAKNYFTLVVLFTVILGIFISIIGLLALRPAVKLLGAKDELLSLGVTYGAVVISFTTFFILQNSFQSFLVVAEKPHLGLLVIIIAGVTNFILDFLFIVCLKMGVVGAGLATGIGQFVGGLIPFLYFLVNKRSSLKFRKPKFEFSPLKKACLNGSSEMMTSISSSLVGLLYNFQLLRFAGEDGVSAYGIIMYASYIFFAIFLGYSIGCAPIVGYHYGAKNNVELKSVLRKSLILTFVSGAIMSILCLVLSRPLSSIFIVGNEGLLNFTTRAFRICSLAFLFIGINVYTSSFFTALNNGVVSAIISFLRSLVFQVIVIIALPLIWGTDGIWVSLFVSEVLSLFVSVLFLLLKRKKYQY